MHDWVLIDIVVNWESGEIIIRLDHHKGRDEIVAKNFSNFIIPKKNEWGESVHVNGTIGPTLLDNKNYQFSIEMQSGDILLLEAQEILLPKF